MTAKVVTEYGNKLGQKILNDQWEAIETPYVFTVR